MPWRKGLPQFRRHFSRIRLYQIHFRDRPADGTGRNEPAQTQRQRGLAEAGSSKSAWRTAVFAFSHIFNISHTIITNGVSSHCGMWHNFSVKNNFTKIFVFCTISTIKICIDIFISKKTLKETQKYNFA